MNKKLGLDKGKKLLSHSSFGVYSGFEYETMEFKIDQFLKLIQQFDPSPIPGRVGERTVVEVPLGDPFGDHRREKMKIPIKSS